MPWEDVFARAFGDGGADPTKGFSPKQRAFDNDRHTRRKWLGTRRSGKTRGLAGHMLKNALPGETVPYCAPTIGVGRQILWPQFELMDKELGLGLQYDRAKHVVTTKSGGRIQIFGLSTMPEAEKLRGGRYPLAVVDEAGAVNQKILKYAVVECLSPATGDFIGMGGRGVVLAGTPSKLVDTWWHEQCKPGIAGEDTSFHFTTLYDNPFFAGREEHVIEQFLADNGLKRTDAAFIREMLGQFIIDTQALCYSADLIQVIPAVTLPTTGMTIMGVDFGFTHPCAWFVLRCVPPNVYVLETRELAGQDVHDIARITRELRAKHKVGHIVGDSEGATIIATLNNRFAIPIQSAAKTGRKLDRIWLMDSYIRSRTMYLGPQTEPYQEQLRSVGWNDDRTDHHPHQNDHLCDAGHYALELACAIGVMDKPTPPEKWSPEWVEAEKAKMRQAAFAQAARRGRR